MNISPFNSNSNNKPSFKAFHYINISNGKFLNKLDVAESAYIAAVEGQVLGKNLTSSQKIRNFFKLFGNFPTGFWNSPGDKYISKLKNDKLIPSLTWLEGHLYYKYGVDLDSIKGLFPKETNNLVYGIITGKESEKMKNFQPKIIASAEKWTDKVLENMEVAGKEVHPEDEYLLGNIGLYLKTNEAVLLLQNSRNVNNVVVNRMSELPDAIKAVKTFERK